MTLAEFLKTPNEIIAIAEAACHDHPESLDAACAAVLKAKRRGRAAELSDEFIIEFVGRIYAQHDAARRGIKAGDIRRSFVFFGFQLKELAELSKSDAKRMLDMQIYLLSLILKRAEG